MSKDLSDPGALFNKTEASAMSFSQYFAIGLFLAWESRASRCPMGEKLFGSRVESAERLCSNLDGFRRRWSHSASPK